jgi:soluble lytic murein transglycosylase-like protein
MLTSAVAGSFAALGLGACGTSTSGSGPGGTTAPSSGAPVPANPRALASRLSAVDVALRHSIDAWRASPASDTPPHDLTLQAIYVQRALRMLSSHPRLDAATIRRLPPGLAYEARQVTRALRDLRRLSAGWPAHRVRAGPPDPLGKLLTHYRLAQRRYGVRWQILAAVNAVESAFGRVRTASVAGARGPMQFMPSTWRVYGRGGDIRDPHDAILGAANLLHHAGAPGSYGRALYAYNPSPLYVDAVRRYARLIAHDRDALYLLYSWPAPASGGQANR